MIQPNYNQQLKNIIDNPDTSIDDLKAIEPIMRDNLNLSVKLFFNYYFVTIVLIVIWLLISNSIIKEIKLFDINISNKKILLFCIPFISIITTYLMISYMAFYQLIDMGMKRIHTKLYKTISETSIMELVNYPSFIELEGLKLRLGSESLMSTLGFLFISITFIFVPIAVNMFICIELIKKYSNSWFYFLPIIYLFILLKIIKNLYFYYNHSK